MKFRKRRNILIAFVSAALLVACSASDNLDSVSTEDLVTDAAAGDAAAMVELERRAEKQFAKLQSDSNQNDPETTFQQVLFSGDGAAMDALIEAGNPYAQTHTAIILSSASDLSETDAAKARLLLEAAADANHAAAVFRMSEDYLGSGKLYPYDEGKAFSLSVQAAELGLREAMYQTGIRYQYGHLTAPVDTVLATAWLEKANVAGHPDAQRQLDELADTADE
ncbi:MAG: hypothetical protein ABJH52_06065 [Henriciella sp.]